MDIVAVRGGGDLASGIIHRLARSGFKVLVLDIDQPSAIRRTVSFSQAIYSGEIEVEGLKGIHAKSLQEIEDIWQGGNIPVYIDPQGKILEEIRPLALVDSILAKKNLGTNKQMAPITIAVGPGFQAGEDVDLVVESKRGHYLGSLIDKGHAIANTSQPGQVMGYREERVIRASKAGKIENLKDIGDLVEEGDLISRIDQDEIRANIGGIIRGLIHDGYQVHEGMKIGDIDPREIKDHAYTISDKARAIAGAVLEGILYLKKERGL